MDASLTVSVRRETHVPAAVAVAAPLASLSMPPPLPTTVATVATATARPWCYRGPHVYVLQGKQSRHPCRLRDTCPHFLCGLLWLLAVWIFVSLGRFSGIGLAILPRPFLPRRPVPIGDTDRVVVRWTVTEEWQMPLELELRFWILGSLPITVHSYWDTSRYISVERCAIAVPAARRATGTAAGGSA